MALLDDSASSDVSSERELGSFGKTISLSPPSWLRFSCVHGIWRAVRDRVHELLAIDVEDDEPRKEFVKMDMQRGQLAVRRQLRRTEYNRLLRSPAGHRDLGISRRSSEPGRCDGQDTERDADPQCTRGKAAGSPGATGRCTRRRLSARHESSTSHVDTDMSPGTCWRSLIRRCLFGNGGVSRHRGLPALRMSSSHRPRRFAEIVRRRTAAPASIREPQYRPHDCRAGVPLPPALAVAPRSGVRVVVPPRDRLHRLASPGTNAPVRVPLEPAVTRS